MTSPLLSIIIPAYNEAPRIGAALEQASAYLAGRGAYEVLVVDDASTDETAAIVSRHAARDPHVRLLRQGRHHGKGAAVRQGMLSATGALLCFMDADLSTPLETLERLVPLLGQADVAVASRAMAGSSLAVRQHPVREVMGKIFNLAVRAMFRMPYRDTQCGCKGFRREAAQAIFSRARTDGFAFDVEALALARALGYAVAELPVRWTDSKPSRVQLVRHPAQMWAELWRIRRNFRRGAYRLDRRAPEAARQTLSAVVLTKNEEARIARCLESARWADEIIVVDGESTDRTVEICRQYGATVISHAFCGDFGHERNLGNEAATGEWILQLDADDAVSPQLRESIERVLREGSPHHAFKFRRRNWFLGHDMRHGGWYHYYPHFFRRGRAHFEGRVHHLLISPEPPVILPGDLEHRPFDSLEQFISRHNRYTAIEAEEMFQKDGARHLPGARYHVARRPLKLFWKTYVKKHGFREGWHGLAFSMLFAWVHALKWAKYWEQCAGPARAITAEIERQNQDTTAGVRELFERRGPAGAGALWAELCWRPASALWKASRGRRPEGELIAGVLAMFARVMLWAKYWEVSCVLRPTDGQTRDAPTRSQQIEVAHAARQA